MKGIFLGKWWHWLLLALLVALLWQVGQGKWHVIRFNWFLIALIAGTVVSLLAIIFTTKPGEQITREALDESESS